MAGVVCGHADACDGRNERVLGDAGILGDHLVQHGGDRFLTRRRKEDVAMVEGLHRFIARTARCQKDNGRGQVLLAKG